MPTLVKGPHGQLWNRPAPWPLLAASSSAQGENRSGAGTVALVNSGGAPGQVGGKEETGVYRSFLQEPILAALLASTFLFLSLCAVLWAHSNEHVDDMLEWSKRPWMVETCIVQEHGMQYLGDCSNATFANMLEGKAPPNYTYTPCDPPKDLAMQKCERFSYVQFRSGGDHMRRLREFEPAEDWEMEEMDDMDLDLASADSMAERRLGMRHAARAVGHGGSMPVHNCKDVFVPWARVTSPWADDKCAYSVGLLKTSRVHDFKAAKKQRARFADFGQNQTCWSLGVIEDGCPPIVAMEDPTLFPEIPLAVVEEDRDILIVLDGFSVLFGICGLLVCVAHCCVRKPMNEHDRFQLDDDYVRTPGSPKKPFGGSKGLQQQWKVFRAGLVADAKTLQTYHAVPNSEPQGEGTASDG